MKYDIQHTDPKLLRIALFTAIGLFLLIETLVIWFIADETLLAIGVLVGFIIPIAYFFIKKRKVKLYGYVEINNHQLIFNVFGTEKTIGIKDIQQYSFTYFKGVSLTLKLKSGEKFTLVANSNFCNAEKFEKACASIEKTIEQFSENTPSLQEIPIREKTVFEKTWFIVLLSICTVGMVIAIIYAIANGKKLHQLLAPLAIFIGLWAGILKSASKRKDN